MSDTIDRPLMPKLSEAVAATVSGGRNARAGKHVLCEKPMATPSADARAMIAACLRAKVKLMIADRIRYELQPARAPLRPVGDLLSPRRRDDDQHADGRGERCRAMAG